MKSHEPSVRLREGLYYPHMESLGGVIGIAVGLVALATAGAKTVAWYRSRRRAKRLKNEVRVTRDREAQRATEDFETALDDLERAESTAYEAADVENAAFLAAEAAKGIFHTGRRAFRYLEIAEDNDRQRAELLKKWRRQLENLGAQIPVPPPPSRTFPPQFTRDGEQFDRMPDPIDELIRCGWCGRLVYKAGRVGVAWWCPEHGYEVS